MDWEVEVADVDVVVSEVVLNVVDDDVSAVLVDVGVEVEVSVVLVVVVVVVVEVAAADDDGDVLYASQYI